MGALVSLSTYRRGSRAALRAAWILGARGVAALRLRPDWSHVHADARTTPYRWMEAEEDLRCPCYYTRNFFLKKVRPVAPHHPPTPPRRHSSFPSVCVASSPRASRHHPARVHVPLLPLPLLSSARRARAVRRHPREFRRAPPRPRRRARPGPTRGRPRRPRRGARASPSDHSLAPSVVVARSPLGIVRSTPTCTSSSNATWIRDGANSPTRRARRSPPPSRHPRNHPRVMAARARDGGGRAQAAARGVFAFPALSLEFCRALREEVAHFEQSGFEPSRPNTMNTNGLLLYELGAYPRLLDPLVLVSSRPSPPRRSSEATRRRLRRGIARPPPLVHRLVRGGKRSGLGVPPRRQRGDPERVPRGDFEGGELLFGGLRDDPEERHLARTPVAHRPGMALLHRGSHCHEAVAVESGERTNLIVWCRSSETRRRTCASAAAPKSERERKRGENGREVERKRTRAGSNSRTGAGDVRDADAKRRSRGDCRIFFHP